MSDTSPIDIQVTFDTADPHRVARFWAEALHFQRVPEGKTVKNRVHFDLHVGKERIDEEVGRLRGLGATPAWESTDRGGRCVTMRDIEGNEFCVE